MCCRYYYSETTIEMIADLTGTDPALFRASDIRPAETAPVLTAGTGKNPFALNTVRWGFLPENTGSLVINARAETVPEKRLFRNSFELRRCLIPADGFYEWDVKKNRHTFTVAGCRTIFMAGLVDRFRGEDRFTIITTAANESIVRVHDRMPLIIPSRSCRDWLADRSAAQKLLSGPSAVLTDSFQELQLSLFDECPDA